MAKGINVRELALETLLAVSRDGRQSHQVTREVLAKYSFLTQQEKAFYLRLTEGTLEYRLRLDYIIDSFSKTPVRRMKPVIREILRLSVCQIFFMDSVPDAAAVNEGVKLAVRKGFSGLKGFVNGVLRTVASRKEEVVYPGPERPADYLRVKYSMPETVSSLLLAEYGFETAETICAAFLEDRPLHARVRGIEQAPGQTFFRTASEEETEAALRELEKEGITAERNALCSDVLELSHTGDPARLPAFRDGRLFIQDASSNLAVRAAGIRKGDTVLDLCAAPGGKSILAADLAGPSGRVIARDLTGRKTDLIRENALRCRTTQLSAETADALVFDPLLGETADVVIADLPCSGLGVIGRKPDIKYGFTEEKARSLVQLQQAILENAVRYLKPGGRLLYSTCTLGRAENQDNARLLADRYSLQRADLSGVLPGILLDDPEIRRSAEQGFVQLLPGTHGTDGFFFSVFIKTA